MSVINQLKTLGVYLSGGPDHRMGINGHLRLKSVITTLATAGPVTFTPAQLMGGLILRDPAGAVRADVFPTATAIINALGNGVVAGSSYDVDIRNTGTATEIITLTAATGVTLNPAVQAVDADESISVRIVVTDVITPTVVVYGLGLDVLTT